MNISVRGNLNLPGSIIYFPLRQLMSNNNKKVETGEDLNNEIGSVVQQGKIRVVLADDDLDDREMFAEAIGEIAGNIALDIAEDGNELLKMLNAKEVPLPNIIFLDLNMPNKSGRECLDVIRKNERLRHIPVVIYSTSASIKDIDETFDGGANLYVRKSSSFKDLVSITKRVLTLNWNKYKPGASRAEFVFTSKTN